MSAIVSLHDVLMSRQDFHALTDSIDHHRRSLAALKAMQPGDSAATVLVDAAMTTTARTLQALQALQQRARVRG